MTAIEISNLEHASRSAMAWTPEGYDGKIHFRSLTAAALSAFGILAVAAALLMAAI